MASPLAMNNMRGGPPMGGTPQGLTSMLPQGGAPEGGVPSPEAEGLGGANPSGGEGGLKDIYDEVSGVLESLAGILPEQADEIEEIRLMLAEVLAKAISGGASFKGRTEEGETLRPNPGLPV